MNGQPLTAANKKGGQCVSWVWGFDLTPPTELPIGEKFNKVKTSFWRKMINIVKQSFGYRADFEEVARKPYA